PRTPVRGLFGTQLLGEQAYVFDTEAPLDTPIYYLASGGPDPWGIQQGPFIIPSNGTVWMKDPGRPWADLSADLCETPTRTGDCTPPGDELAWVGFGTKTRRMDAGVFDVLDRERAADVYARRKDLDTTCQFLSRTLTALDNVYDLYTVGGPLLFQLPTVYGFKDKYLQPGDLTEDYISQDQRKPYRLWGVPLTAVEPPVGEPQGTDVTNWCAYRDTYATFADVPDDLTWGDVAAGDAIPGGA